MDIKMLQAKLRAFADEREWDQFHSPKNLSMALAGEAGELLEIFQWLTEEESRQLPGAPDKLRKVEEEVADIGIYLVRLCDKLGIDLESAITAKMVANGKKYPADKARGRAAKYDEL